MRWQCCIIGVLVLPASTQQQALGQHAITDPAEDLLEWMADDEEIDPDVMHELRAILDAPLDVNRASVEALVRIPGIDHAMAGSLVRHRQMHGEFADWDSVVEVLGVGLPLSEHLRPFFTLGTRTSEQSRQTRMMRAHAALQHFQRRDVSVLRTTSRSRPIASTRRSLLRLSVRYASGFGGRLTISNEGGDARAAIGGVQATAMRGRIVAVGGAFAARFGAGLVLSGGGVRDKWQFAGGSSSSGSMRLRPRGSATGIGAMSGAALQLIVSDGPVISAFHARGTADAGRVSGLALELPGTRHIVGVLLLAGSSSDVVTTDVPLHALHRARGGSWRSASAYFGGGYRSLRLSVEAALASSGAGALVGTIGIRSQSSRRVTLAYRWVSPRFSLRLGRPDLMTATDGTGERGLLIGASASIGAWSIRFVADAFNRLWASAGATWPSPSYDLRLEATRKWRILTGTIRLAHRADPADVTVVDQVGRELSTGSFAARRSLRGQIDLRPIARLSFRTRFELVRSLNAAGVRTHGALLYEQLRWQPLGPVLVEARNVTFITTSSDARLYLHEGDVLYQPVLAVVSGEGDRRYVRLRIDLCEHVTLEGKIGAVRLTPPATASDAAPFPQRRTEMRFQLLLKP